ncbi:serine/threonine-protein kinase [Nocardiopsis valliformis]|uniref:serine/threonine-protein kinase n=1 Tax=Nocardiopsis valliformis TaxID=239974 RepID=UPI000348C18B|nr:serine/threonine-protein kinase [Nocardiopsis valliformis]
MPHPHPEPPERIGPYRIVSPLGSGGMGHVHLGIDPGNRPVAVKVVRPEFAFEPEFRERFAHEVHRARQVTGGDLPRILDADTTGSSPWFATEFVLGPSLQEMSRRIGALPEPAVRYLGRSIAQTLAHLHSSGVVHRDLKPGNVLLAATGPKVIDLGISRAMDETPGAESAEFAGTPGYIAPETTRGEESGPAVDVFALGAVLVFALTGRGPFGDGHPSAVIYRIGHQDPDLDGVPASLHDLLTACLDKDPARRPTAAQVLQALGGPVPPAATASAWLPQIAVAVLDGFEHDHRAVLRPFLETTPVPEKSRRGRTLAVVGAAATALLLVAGAGVWAVTGPLDREEGNGEAAEAAGSDGSDEESTEEGAFSDRNGRCDPTADLAPEYTEAVTDETDLTGEAMSVHFSNDGSVLAVQRRDHIVSLWDWQEGVSLADIPVPETAARSVVFSPDDCLIGLGSDDGAHVYSLETGEHHVYLEGRNASSMAFSADGASAIISDSAWDDDLVGIYPVDLATGEVSTRYSSSSAQNVRFSPEGTRMAAKSALSLKVWDTDSREEVFSSGWLTTNSMNEIAFVDEDTVVGIHQDGAAVFDLSVISSGDEVEGYLYAPEEEPEGKLSYIETNPVHGLVYGLYLGDRNDEGLSLTNNRVWHHPSGRDVTPEGEDLIPFIVLDVHPDGDVLATPALLGDEIRILDAVSLEEIDAFG